MNQLDVSQHYSIATLAAKGWSARKIARELGGHRETVGRGLDPVAPDPKLAILPAGSRDDSVAKPAIVGWRQCFSGPPFARNSEGPDSPLQSCQQHEQSRFPRLCDSI